MTGPTGVADALLARLDFVAVDAGDPVEWVRSELDEELWSKQREIAASVKAHPRTAVQSAHSTGKSFLAARLAAFWISAHPVGDAFVVLTAPSQAQVDTIGFRELGRAHRKGDLRGTLTGGGTPRWRIGEEIVAIGRKPQDLVNAEEAAAAFQGIHARYILVVIDEAAGVPPWLWDAVDSLATNEHARVLAIGNPTDPASRFAKVCAPGSGWNVLKVSAFDTPAFTGEVVADSLLEQLVSPAWVERMRRQWGEGSPRYVARVLAEQPDEADDGLVSAAWVRAAQEQSLPAAGEGCFGCDIARAGDDETVVYRNRGGVVRLVHRSQGHDLMRTTGAIANLVRPHNGGVPAVVDAIGIGAGVFDRLREQRLAVLPFQGSERARRHDRFVNRRAEVFWDLREALREGLLDLDPDDEQLAAQLVAIRFVETSRGLIQIESKADMKRRGVPSPDRADAVAMSLVGGHWRPPVPVDPLEEYLRAVRAASSPAAVLELRLGDGPRRTDEQLLEDPM